MASDLEMAYNAITKKRIQHTEAFGYYDGNQPLVFANERLASVFDRGQVKFTENWCGVVVDSLKERMNLKGLVAPGEAGQVLANTWDELDMGIESDELHEAMLITGEAYLIVWTGNDGGLQVYYNDPRLCQAFYHSDDPRVMRFAAKMWTDDDGYGRMTLYYADRLEYYKTSDKAENVSDCSAYQAMVDEEGAGWPANPTGRIPVFHFRTRRRVLSGELANVIPVQNGVNKLLTDMMVAAEFGAFRQRWVISNSDLTKLKNKPNEVWSIPSGDGLGQNTQVGEFSVTELKNYLDAVAQLAGDIARITRTPKHYFFSAGGDPSGEALIAMEAPLNKKAGERIEHINPTWRQVAAFIVELKGSQIRPAEVTPLWDAVETVQPLTEAQIRRENVAAGMPLVTALRREGWSDEELEKMAKEQTEEGTRKQNSLALALLEQQRNFDVSPAEGL
jgi:hypothetical protein